MTPHLQELVQRARSGDFGDFEKLLDALRTAPLSPAVLREYARSPEMSLRRAAVALGVVHRDPELLAVLAELASDDESAVRLALASAIAANPGWWSDGTILRQLLEDDDCDVRKRAAEAALRWPDLEAAVLTRLAKDDYWGVRRDVARMLSGHASDAVLPALLAALGEDADSDVQQEAAAALEQQLLRLGTYPAGLKRPPFNVLREAHGRAAKFRSGTCPRLLAWLEERVTNDVDLELLRTYGTVLTLEAEAGRLPRAYHVEDAVDAVLKVLTGDAPRAAVLVGESGCGKTALVYELTHRLRDDPDGPWHVLRVSPAEFLAGTVYLGEWETKLKKLIDAARHPRRVLLYVPNLEELAYMGVSSKSDANVATALAPHIERGDIAIIGESTPESFRKGLGAVRSLRRLFHSVQMTPADTDDTRAILVAVGEEAGVEVPEAVQERLLELADFYVSGTVQPGRSVGLLRRVLGTVADRAGPVTQREILDTISTSTGIPVDFLDDAVPLDRAKVRTFFEARVMGQPEAVEAVLDMVTLVKAGLTDPNKPFGVLMFVGPTGVGKTEMARALAELLFGDPTRMVRLDMSEYATYEAYERLIGQGANAGLLTATVRERPFCVLLLDEIEKSHLNIYDLCLQIFDAGRLTDTQGRTADFRRTIIIMTSNVGSRVQQEAPVGFGRVAPPQDPNLILRELSRSFRPEFLNRIDRIVTFRPLSEETAEKIARRELAAVVERGGIARRRLVVDVDPAVLPLLLRDGYSPAYGARPLKRTVERMVLLPVAKVIASGEALPGSVLRLVARRGRIEVEVVAPENGDAAPAPEAAPRSPVKERAERLWEQVEKLRDGVAPLSERKSELLARAAAPGLWDDRDAAQALYDEVYRIDGVLGALDGLERAARDQVESLRRLRGGERDVARREAKLDALEAQAAHVAFLIGCRSSRDLGDTFVTLRRVLTHGDPLDAVGTLARMYVNLARRHHLEVEVIDDHQGGDPPEDAVTLLVTGAGAHALLCGETGLHQISRGKRSRRDGKPPGDREVVRVEVLPMPTGEDAAERDAITAEVRPLNEVAARFFARAKLEVRLRHGPSLLTLRAWTDRPKAEAIERLGWLLRARVAAARAAETDAAAPAVVRRYSLGPAPLVRDARTGRTTGRLDDVLEGHLDAFLQTPAREP